MNNLKKIIALSLIPLLLTIYFIVQFTLPSVKEYLNLKKQIKTEKTGIKDVKSNIEMLKRNKKLLSRLNELKKELTGFEIEFPERFQDEILLIDLEIFADEAVNKIASLESIGTRQVKIIDPEKVPAKDKRRLRKQEDDQEQLINIFKKSVKLDTVAYYDEITDFITMLEDYQRRVDIDGIHIRVFEEDKGRLNPRVQLQINGNIYKSRKNKIVTAKKQEKNLNKRVVTSSP